MADNTGARTARSRLDDWMANPGCEQNEASAILNFPLSKLDGAVKSDIEPSVFATFLGNQFEKHVVYQIGPLLTASGQIGINIDATWSTASPKSTSEASQGAASQLDESVNRIKSILNSKSGLGRNHILNGFRIPFDPFPPAKTLEIDLVAISPAENIDQETMRLNVVVGEVKVYADQGGFTDEHKISGARRQAGLYLGILQDWLNGLTKNLPEFHDYEFTVVDRGFVVLTQPHSVLDAQDENDWSTYAISVVVNEDFSAQRDIISNNYEALLAKFAKYGEVNLNGDQEKKDFIAALPHEFNEGCWGRCALAAKCFEDALVNRDPIILGSRVKNAMRGLDLGEVQTMARQSLDDSITVDAKMTDAMATVARDFDEFRFRELDEI